MSVRTKLTVIVLALVIVPILFVSLITFSNYQNSLEKSRLTNLQVLAQLKTEQIESYFDGIRTNIRFAQNFYIVRKNLPVLIHFSNDPRNPVAFKAREMLDNHLIPIQKVMKLTDIMLIDTSGIIVYTSNPGHVLKELYGSVNDRWPDLFSRGVKEIYTSDIFINEESGNKPQMLFAAPIAGLDDIPMGIIVFELDVTNVYGFITDTTGLGGTGEILLGKKSGNQIELLNPLRHDRAGTGTRYLHIGGRVGVPIQNAVLGENGSGKSIDYRGKKVIAAWRYIPSLKLGLVAKIDSEEDLRVVSHLKHLVIIILAIILLMVTIITFSVAQSIAWPIQRLSKGAEIIGSGNLDYRVGTTMRDEVGQLSRSFDRMTHDLKMIMASRDDLDKEIAERKRAEVTQQHMVSRFELLSYTAAELLRTAEPEKVIESLCRKVMEHLDCQAFFNFIVDECAEKLHLNAFAGIPAEEALKIEWLEFGSAVCGCVAQTGCRIVAERIPTTSDIRTNLIKSFGIKAYACHPMVGAQGKILGTLSFGTRTRETFTDKDISLMKAVADQVATAIVRMRNEQALNDLNKQLEIQLIEIRDANTTLRDSRRAALNLMEDALTARKEAEQAAIALRISREDLNRAQAVARIGSWRMDVQRNALTWSDETYRIFGIPRGTPLTYETFLSMIHPDDRVYVDDAWKTALSGEPYDIEHRIVADGIVKWVRETAEMELDENGSLRGGFGTTQDITERKLMENELVEKRSQLEKLVFQQTNVITDTRESLDIETKERMRVQEELTHRQQALEAVYAMATAFDTSPETMNDQVVISIAKILQIPFASLHRVSENRARMSSIFCNGKLADSTCCDISSCIARMAELTGPHSPRENRTMYDYSRCNNCFPHEKTCSYAGVKIHNSLGDISGIICVLDSVERTFDEYDIRLIEIFARYLSHEQTQRELELQLSRSNELKVLGKLTSGVAHEVRNPLNGIMAIMGALSKELSDDDRFKPYLYYMQNQVVRLTTLMEDLLAFGRPIREEKKEAVPVVLLVQKALTDWLHSIKHDRKVQFAKSENGNNGLMIRADIGRIEQVMINLLDNAHQHSTLDKQIDLSVESSDFDTVRISVKDRGLGIREEIMEQIFEPFYTTRKGGTGLGLSIVRHIIQSHGGTIYAQNNEDCPGATFVINLPLSGANG